MKEEKIHPTGEGGDPVRNNKRMKTIKTEKLNAEESVGLEALMGLAESVMMLENDIKPANLIDSKQATSM